MASSVSSVNASAMSSIYGNRNVISGLASGLDTESMIENAVSGIKMKISGLQQDKTKVQWEQEAIRSIIDKLVDFNQKYTSYASDTNLMSASFFNSAVKVSTAGKFADLISASGKTSSNVQILGVKQLATAAKYTITGLGNSGSNGVPTIAGDKVDLTQAYEQSKVSGTLSITYGTKKINLSFDDTVYKSDQEFADAINKKLQDLQVTNSDGETVSASTMVKAELKDGKITFSEANNAGNEVYISGASGSIKSTLGIDGSKKETSIDLPDKLYDDSETIGQYVSGKELSFTLDGVTKTITLPEYSDGMTGKEFRDKLQSELDDAFGAGKISLDDSTFSKSNLRLNFKTQEGSTLVVSGDAAKALGLGGTTATSYLDTSKTLDDLGVDFSKLANNRIEVTDARLVAGTTDSYVDSEGNAVKKDTDGKFYRVDDKGDFLYKFEVNGKVVGNYSKNTALESIVLDINNSDAGVNVTYSKTTNQFQFTAKETGAAGKIEFGPGLAQELFGGSTTVDGKDAILSMEVNGVQYDGIPRSSNSFDIDGLTVNLKGTFGTFDDTNKMGADAMEAAASSGEAVTFTSTTDADKIVDAVKSFVEDYNTMITEIKNAYSTMPAQKSDGSNYEPLTSDDSEGMTESEIEAYEEKAKQGILFADRDISDLYSALNSAINPGGTDASFLRSIGIDTAYSDGLTTLKLDEDALRAALESDPDGVKDAFTKTVSSGASTDGLMQTLKTAVDKYGKETGTKGILLTRAGSVKAPTTLNDNTLQDKLNDLDDEIEKWQDQLSTKIDWYTSQFTQLEQLILQMNSQSSTLSGLMGGGSY